MGYIEKLVSSDETIVAQRRPHWVVLLNAFVGLFWQIFLLLLLYWLFIALARGDGPLSNIGFLMKALDDWRRPLSLISNTIPQLIGAFIVLSSLIGLARTVLNWVNTTNIVTTRRVIQVHGVIAKSSIDSSLEKVNDIMLSQSATGRVLNFGHLVIMTASEVGLNRMLYLPDPVGFKRAILDAKNTLGGPPPPQAVQSGAAADRLAELGKLLQQGLITQTEYDARRQAILNQI
ncbi:MAG: PH domain-containing protein [Anaerolineae bacterium]|nr:PH domain-containing protein [Anaerolineae bacterium]